MQTWLLFALLGLGIGSVYAALGTGVVVVYKGTGVINFATGAMAVWGAFVCDEMRRRGDLVLPVLGLPDRIHIADGPPLAVAIIAGVASAAVIALIVNALVVRPMSTAPVLAKVVASVGLMILFQGLVALKFGSTPRSPKPILPNAGIKFGSLSVPRDRLLLAAIAIVMGGVLWAWFKWGRTGLAVVASSENEQAASLAGFSPQRLAGVTWVVGIVAATLMVILASPITNLDGVTFTLLIVPALAVALLGRLQSVPIAVAAGLALGIVQSCLTQAKSQSWFPAWARQGVNDALPFLMVVAVLFLMGKSLPERGSARTDPLPRVIIPKVRPITVAGLVLGATLAVVLTSGSYRFGVITSMIGVIIALSIVLLTGTVGQISLAQAAFAGAAGFVLSKIGTAVPFPFSILLAGLAAAVLGVLVGIPALRIRGAQLAVVTLSAAVAIEQLVFRNPAISPIAGNPIPAPSLLGFDLGIRQGTNVARVQFGLLVLVVVTAVTFVVANLMRSATGRRFLAIRDNEKAGAALGINVPLTKLTAFAISSFVAGIGGALIGYSRGQLSPDSFGLFVGLSMLAFAYLGGITSITGAFIAGAFAPLGIGYVILDRVIGTRVDAFDKYYFVLGGLGLVISAVRNPVGIAGDIRNRRAARRAKRAAKNADLQVSPSLPAALPAGVAHARPRPKSSFKAGGEAPLRVEGLSVSFGGVRAVDDVSLTVGPSRIVGLIGPNGAGKTTFIDAVTGFVPSTGRVWCRADEITGLPPHRRAAAGVARTWQTLELFDELTVRENIMIGADRAGPGAFILDALHPARGSTTEDVDWAIELLGLADDAESRPSELSLGSQKLLGVARTLAMAPSVILLDEPAAGLDTSESLLFGENVRRIVEAGTSVLLVDHDMGLILDVCDDLFVMTFGEVLASGTPDEVRRDARVVEAYLGATAEGPAR
jgi:ABC-type branched-subunit amino acid transport system ATPase component/branched-subunit amino acid ABC-type transport system permease component